MPNDVKLRIGAKDQTKRAFRSVQTNLQGITRRVTGLHAQVGALVGVAGFGALIKRQTEAAASSLAWSKALGVNIESLSRWQHAAKDVRIEGDKVADIFKDLSEKIGDAFANDAGEGKDALASLNLSAAELVKLAPDQQLLKIANALDQVGTQSEKIQILESLGSDLSRLLPLLDDNAAGFRRLAKEADDTGATLTKLEAESLKKLDETNRRISASLEGLAQNWTLAFGNKFASTVDYISTSAVPAFAHLAEELGIINREVSSKSLDELWAQRGALEHKIANLQAAIRAGDLTGESGDRAIQKTWELQAELKKVIAQQERIIANMNKPLINAPVGNRGSSVPEPGPGTGSGGFVARDIFNESDPKLMAAIATEERLDELYEQKQADRLEREKEHARMWENVWANSINNFATGIGDAFAGVIVDQRNMAEAMQSLMKGVARQVISSLVEIGVKRAIFQAQAEAAKNAIVLSGVASAQTLALAYAAPAALVSLASYGANAAPAQAGIAATYGLTQNLALAGMAHEGLDNVPREGTYLLDKGEMVLDKGTSDQVRNNMTRGGDLVVNIQALDAKSFSERIREHEQEIWNNLLDRMNEEGVRFA